MIRTIELAEWATARGVELAHEEARALQGTDAGLKIVAGGVAGRYDIEASHYVGSIATPTLRVVIRPKLPIRRLLYLLGLAGDTAVFRDGGILGEAPDLLVAMQWLYARCLERALRTGPLEGYDPREDSLQVVRGRIDHKSLCLRRFGIAPPIDCRFDEFTADIELNRRLLGAALLLRRADRSTEASLLLSNLIDRFGTEVRARTRLQARDSAVPIDRRTRRFESAIRLAELVLRGSSLELADGRLDLIGFLVDMNAAYESFASELLRRALNETPATWLRHPRGLWLDDEESIAIEPDILWRSPLGVPLLPIDLKYKLAEVNADAYQMLAYCTALGARRGVLIYADAEPAVHHIKEAGIEIHVLRLSPDGEPPEIHENARRAAEFLREFVRSPEAHLEVS